MKLLSILKNIAIFLFLMVFAQVILIACIIAGYIRRHEDKE